MNLFENDTVIRRSVSDRLQVTKNIENILFPIQKRPLLTRIAENDYIDTGYNGIFKEDGTCLYAGREYEIVDNEEIMNGLEPFIKEGFDFERVENYGDTKFKIDLIKRDEGYHVKDQLVHPRIHVSNSYDGSNSLFMAMGAFIAVCMNGLIVGQATTIKRRHTRGINDFNIGEFFENGYRKTKSECESILGSKEWSNDTVVVEKKFDELIKPFVKDDKIHYTATMIKNRFIYENELYKSKEFALMMAATYIGTHGYKEGLSYANQNIINDRVKTVFFN